MGSGLIAQRCPGMTNVDVLRETAATATLPRHDIDSAPRDPESRRHGTYGRLSLRQYSCAASAFEAAGRSSVARMHMLVLPEPQPSYRGRSRRVIRGLGR